MALNAPPVANSPAHHELPSSFVPLTSSCSTHDLASLLPAGIALPKPRPISISRSSESLNPSWGPSIAIRTVAGSLRRSDGASLRVIGPFEAASIVPAGAPEDAHSDGVMVGAGPARHEPAPNAFGTQRPASIVLGIGRALDQHGTVLPEDPEHLPLGCGVGSLDENAGGCPRYRRPGGEHGGGIHQRRALCSGSDAPADFRSGYPLMPSTAHQRAGRCCR